METTNGSFRRFRWALEPVVGLFLGLIAMGIDDSAGRVTVLVSATIGVGVAVSRIHPQAALASVVLVGAMSVNFRQLPLPSLLVVEIGAVIIFGAVAAFGTVRQMWVAFGGALLAFLVGELKFLIFIASIGDHPETVVGWLWNGGIFALLSPVVIFFAIVISIGPWFFGRLSRQRSDNGRRSSAFIRWLAVPVLLPPLSALSPRVFRSISIAKLRFDVAIAGAFLLLDVATRYNQSWTGAVVAGIFTVALGLRRLSPMLALAVCWPGVLAQVAMSTSNLLTDVIVLAVLYATASYGSRGVRWAGLISAAGITVVRELSFGVLSGNWGLGDYWSQTFVGFGWNGPASNFAVCGLSWTLGFLVRTWREARRSRSAEGVERARREEAESIAALEHERNQIARDVHDIVAHSLAVIIAQADGARYLQKSQPEAVDVALRAIAGTSRDALADVRVLLSRLRHDETNSPVPDLDAIDRIVERVRSSGLTVEVVRTGLPTPIASGTQVAVFRIVQEALTNALRHGDTREVVRVGLEWSSSGLKFSIRNGVTPVEPGSGGFRGGHGLHGMRERAFFAGGNLSVEERGRFFVVDGFVPGLSHSTEPPSHNRVGKDTQ